MEDKTKQFCTNCKKFVGATSFASHSDFCERKIKICDICDEPISKDSIYPKHDTESHISSKCELCDISVKIWLLPEHEEVCPKRPLICEFCEVDFPFDGYERHVDFCGSRTERCSLCPKYIVLKNMKEHFEFHNYEEKNDKGIGNQRSDLECSRAEHDLEITDTKQNSENDADIIELPSATTDKDITFPQNITYDDPSIYGKWLIFTNGDLERQDYLWIELKTLIKSGDLILILSAKKDENRGPLQGVIMCYTCKDINIIRRSGLAIQKILNENIIIDYKTNEASSNNLYRAHGHRFISRFMLTATGKLYERDKLRRWKQITDDEFENYSFEENCSESFAEHVDSLAKRQRLDSESNLYPSQETRKKKSKYFYPDDIRLQPMSGVWCLFCDVGNVVDGLTELDKTWIQAKKLRDEGFFKLVICETMGLKSTPGIDFLRRTVMCEIREYDFRYDYVKSDRLTQSADKLRERISYNFPMYFKVFCYEHGKPQYNIRYLYTEDRDLYEYLETKWKLVKRA